MLIGVVGDYNPSNVTHRTLEDSLEHAGGRWEWIATDAVPSSEALVERYGGLWIAPSSPYRSMDGALAAIRTARERDVPLVGT